MHIYFLHQRKHYNYLKTSSRSKIDVENKWWIGMCLSHFIDVAKLLNYAYKLLQMNVIKLRTLYERLVLEMSFVGLRLLISDVLSQFCFDLTRTLYLAHAYHCMMHGVHFSMKLSIRSCTRTTTYFIRIHKRQLAWVWMRMMIGIHHIHPYKLNTQACYIRGVNWNCNSIRACDVSEHSNSFYRNSYLLPYVSSLGVA